MFNRKKKKSHLKTVKQINDSSCFIEKKNINLDVSNLKYLLTRHNSFT